MFRRALIVSFLLTLTAFGYAFYHYAIPRPSDLAKYLRSKGERAPRTLQREPALQKRLGVRKDFWIPREGERKHLSITSEGSELILIDRDGKIEATELLQNLEGSMVEEEEMRRFSAEEGTYSYPTHRFLAKDAAFTLFQGSEPDPFLQGIAEKVNFSFFANSPLLSAERVEFKSSDSFRLQGEQASYSALERTLEIRPSCRLEFQNASLQCEGPLTILLEENSAETGLPFHYEDAEFRIDAASGKLLYAENGEGRILPQTIQCEGAVRLTSTENYALADELVYFPETRMLHLFAKNENRVLFWKSDGSIQISAPEVAAHLAGRDEGEEIKGIGDVHFSFDLEEEHRIETLFGKYL